MKDFVDLMIIIIVFYLLIEFSIKYIYEKVSWMLTDKDKLVEQGIMRHRNTIRAEEFFLVEEKLISRGFATKGIYVFENQSNGMCYVGQSVNLLRRIREHLSGYGSEGVHKAMSRGDKFTIRFIRIAETNFSNLDGLEKYYINKHNSYYEGYNKTRGNH